MHLRWIERNDIDVSKWEQCINSALFPSIYGRYWFWDAMTDGNWQAIVWDDYKAVLPVYRKTKWGIKYITMPFLCQSTGIFHNTLNLTEVEKLYIFLTRYASKIDIKLIHQPGFGRSTEKTNQIIDLSNPYQEIQKAYHRNTVRNINKAKLAGVQIYRENDIDILLNFLKENDASDSIQKFHHHVRQLIATSFQIGNGFGLKAMCNGELVSVGFFIEDNKRLYFLLCASNETGKKTRSMFQLIDQAIQSNASKNLIFDFTGSTIANIARRNEGFGANNEQYYFVKWNILKL